MVSVALNVQNNGSEQGNLLLQMKLTQADPTTGAITVVDVFTDPAPFSAPKGINPRTITHQAPGFLKGDFKVLLSLSNSGGLTYSMTWAGTVRLAGTGDFALITPSGCSLSVDGDTKQYPTSIGVDVSKTEVLRGVCVVKNQSVSAKEYRLGFTQFRRSQSSGESVRPLEIVGEGIAFKSGESKEITFVIPRMEAPQAYDAVVAFYDASGKLSSNELPLHYVVRGLSATIQQAQYVGDADTGTVAVSFDWTVSADSHFQARKRSVTAPGTYSAQASIEDQSGAVCATSEKKPLENGTGHTSVSAALSGECSGARVKVAILDPSGTVLDQQTINPGAPLFAPNQSKGVDILSGPSASTDGGRNRVLAIVGLALLLILFVIAFVQRRRTRPTVIGILFVILLLRGGEASAVQWGLHYNVYGDVNHYVNTTATASLEKTKYAPGDTVNVTITLQDSICNDGWFAPTIFGFVSGPQSPNYGVFDDSKVTGTVSLLTSPGDSDYPGSSCLNSKSEFQKSDFCTQDCRAAYEKGQLSSTGEATPALRDPIDPQSPWWSSLDPGMSWGPPATYPGQQVCPYQTATILKTYVAHPLRGNPFNFPLNIGGKPVSFDQQFTVDGGTGITTITNPTHWAGTPYTVNLGTVPNPPVGMVADYSYDSVVCVRLQAGFADSFNSCVRLPVNVMIPPRADGVCGPAAKDYAAAETGFSGDKCTDRKSTVVAINPYIDAANADRVLFPTQGNMTQWQCSGISGGNPVRCTATRKLPTRLHICPATGLTLNPGQTSMNPLKAYYDELTCPDSKPEVTAQWSSSDPNIATVDGGTVTAGHPDTLPKQTSITATYTPPGGSEEQTAVPVNVACVPQATCGELQAAQCTAVTGIRDSCNTLCGSGTRNCADTNWKETTP